MASAQRHGASISTAACGNCSRQVKGSQTRRKKRSRKRRSDRHRRPLQERRYSGGGTMRRGGSTALLLGEAAPARRPQWRCGGSKNPSAAPYLLPKPVVGNAIRRRSP